MKTTSSHILPTFILMIATNISYHISCIYIYILGTTCAHDWLTWILLFDSFVCVSVCTYVQCFSWVGKHSEGRKIPYWKRAVETATGSSIQLAILAGHAQRAPSPSKYFITSLLQSSLLHFDYFTLITSLSLLQFHCFVTSIWLLQSSLLVLMCTHSVVFVWLFAACWGSGRSCQQREHKNEYGRAMVFERKKETDGWKKRSSLSSQKSSCSRNSQQQVRFSFASKCFTFDKLIFW